MKNSKEKIQMKYNMTNRRIKTKNSITKENNWSIRWRNAKISGHENEERIKKFLKTPKNQQELLNRINLPKEKIDSISVGGLHETNVESIITGKTTKSKTDLKIICNSGKTINISIKKSLKGQVYLVRAGLFIEIFQSHFKKQIPENIQRAIKLFWAEANNAVSIIEKHADKNDQKNYDQQIKHKSLNATTLMAYDEELANGLLDWFKSNIYELTKLSFAMGAAKNPSDWAEFVWYKNRLGEHKVDEIIEIKKICKKAKKHIEKEIYFGDKNGGTTIQLPFGFVQWHKSQMQFHHNYEKITKLLKS